MNQSRCAFWNRGRWAVLALSLGLMAATARAGTDAPAAIDWPVWQHIAVQAGGRIKPLDSYAREMVRTISGKERFGKVERIDGEQKIVARYEPTELLVRWVLEPDKWQDQPILQVTNLELRKKLGMAETDKWIAPDKLGANTWFLDEIARLEHRQKEASDKNEEFKFTTTLEEKTWDLGMQVSHFEGLAHVHDGKNMTVLAVVPNPEPREDHWLPLGMLIHGKFTADGVTPENDPLTAIPAAGLRAVHDQFAAARAAFRSSDPDRVVRFNAASRELAATLRRLSEAAYATARTADGTAPASVAAGVGVNPHLASKAYPTYEALHREVHLNTFAPFHQSWILYALAAVLFSVGLMLGGPKGTTANQVDRATYGLSLVVYLAALAMSAYGFYLRIRIAGRPPVSNMYETVIWVSFMASVFGLILEGVYRQRFIALAGAVMAMLGMILADNGGMVLDPAINTLTPVLRSNLWLTVHVLTIVSSYAAFALTLGLANLALGYYIFAPHRTSTIRTLANFVYRAEQIGVVLVAAGTILGGVWADYSWGRFWGWDPKEVWALIVLLVYIALLHARYFGFVRTFGFVAWSAICFTAVVMSWYGVNFVLGVGLHSYGFGKGGLAYVLGGVGIEYVFVGIALVRFLTSGATRSLAASRDDQGPPGEDEDVEVLTAE